MINAKEIEEIGFTQIVDTSEYTKDGIGIFLNEDGIIIFVRQNDNYHGLTTRITTLFDLRTFLSMLK